MNTDRLYPSSTDESASANTFADFFAEEISKSRISIQGAKSNLSATSRSPATCTARLSSSSQVNCSVFHKLLTGLTKKYCSVDPLPACVLKECSDTLLPIFTIIINCSLSHGVMPDSLKTAVVTLTKKKNAGLEIFSNFRPISDLKLSYL